MIERRTTSDGRPYWVATYTYTATCPEGKSGYPVTRTRSGESFVSDKDAERIARSRAERDAKCELQCEFAATASFTGLCGYTATETATDPCSPEVAQLKAEAAARAEATRFCIYGPA